MTEEITHYESLRNHQIGKVISQTDTEVVLDFDGTQKTIKMSNLKRWYKPCGLSKEDRQEANKNASKTAKLDKLVSKPDKPNGDLPPKEDCEQLATKIISYLEKNDCLTKKTCSYTRVRLNGYKHNIMEVWWGKRLTGIKIVVRHEAVKDDERLFKMGRVCPPTHMYVLDEVFKFNNSSNIVDIYALVDKVIAWEKNYKPKKEANRQGRKNGDGRINGKQSLKSKRDSLGIKDDKELAKEQEELAKKTEDLEKELQKTPVVIAQTSKVDMKTGEVTDKNVIVANK